MAFFGTQSLHASLSPWESQYQAHSPTQLQLSQLTYQPKATAKPFDGEQVQTDIWIRKRLFVPLTLFGKLSSQWNHSRLTEKSDDKTVGLAYRILPDTDLQIQLDFPNSTNFSVGAFSHFPAFATEWEANLGAGLTLDSILSTGSLIYYHSGYFYSLSGFVSLRNQFSDLQLRALVGYQLSAEVDFSISASQGILEGRTFAATMHLNLGKSAGETFTESPTQGVSRIKFLLESRVLAANDRLNLVKIDKGSQDGIEMGQIFDIFSLPARDENPGSDPIARGEVLSVKNDRAVLEIKEYYDNLWIDEGFIAKRPNS